MEPFFPIGILEENFSETMASSSTPNISQALTEGDDLNHGGEIELLYYEPHWRWRTVYQHAYRTSGGPLNLGQRSVKEWRTLAKSFVKQQMTSPKQLPDTSESVEDQPMDIEILDTQTPIKVAAQQKGPMKSLSAKAIPYTPKGKQTQVSYADMVKQDPKDDVRRPTSPSPLDKKRKTGVRFQSLVMAKVSLRPQETTRAPLPKTISTVMTGYEPQIRTYLRDYGL
ncbi:unnamed protein product [Rhizophagus irregularis]|nr:unnamed protein product [Rhizophagus irregularis]